MSLGRGGETHVMTNGPPRAGHLADFQRAHSVRRRDVVIAFLREQNRELLPTLLDLLKTFCVDFELNIYAEVEASL